MKKALVVLLILAVAGGVFAQDVKFTGSVFTGLGVGITDVEDSDPMLGIYSMDNAKGARANLIADYANAAGTVGAKIQLRGEGNDGAFAVVAPQMWGWLKAFDGMFTLRAGRMDDGATFGTAGGIDTSFSVGTGTGLFAIISPISGLDIGVSGYAKDEYVSTLLEDGRFQLAFAYTLPDLVTIIGHFRHGTGYNGDINDVLVGAKVLALKGMGLDTLNIDAALLNLGKAEIAAAADGTANVNNKNMIIQIGERAVFKTGAIEVGGRFLQQFRLFDGDKPANEAADLTFHVWGQYAMGSIVPRIDGLFNMGTGWKQDLRRWDGIGKQGFNSDSKNLQIRPSVQFRFGDVATTNNFIELGYTLFKDLSEGAGDNGSLSMAHNIYVDYKVSF